jgi:hypothetical protein
LALTVNAKKFLIIIKLHYSNVTNLYWWCSDPLLQISALTITIKDEARKQIYLQILSDQFCMKIISSIIDGPKTAVEIAKTTSIPISTVYRRLQFLQENKMLKTSGGLNKDGKYFTYLSKLKAASTFFNGSEIWVSVTPNLHFTIN